MATILPFPEFDSVSTPPRSVGRTHTSAEIIIFPGVRVEYWDDGADKPKPQKKVGKRRKHRDVLELMD